MVWDDLPSLVNPYDESHELSARARSYLFTNCAHCHMPGGGGIKGTNYCYNIAPKDGSFLCEPLNPLALAQLLRPKGIKYDANKFHFLGNASNMNGSFAVWHTVKIKTLMDAKNTEVIFAGTGKGSESYYDPTIVNNLFGTKFKLVGGYRGINGIDLAIQQDELDGRGGSYLSWISRKPDWVRDVKVKFLVQNGLAKLRDLPTVPLRSDLAPDARSRQLLELLSSAGAVGRSIVAPADIPPERVAILRTAFDAIVADAGFKSSLAKRNLPLNPVSGAKIQQIVRNTVGAPKDLAQELRKILGL